MPADTLVNLIVQIVPDFRYFNFYVWQSDVLLGMRHAPEYYWRDQGCLTQVFGKQHVAIMHMRPQQVLYKGKWRPADVFVARMHNEIFQQRLQKISEATQLVNTGTLPAQTIPEALRLLTGTGINVDAWAERNNLHTTVLEFPEEIIRQSVEYLQYEVPEALEIYDIDKMPLSVLLQGYEDDAPPFLTGTLGVLVSTYPRLRDLRAFTDNEGYSYILATPGCYDEEVAMLEQMFPGFTSDIYALVYDSEGVFNE